MFTTILVPIDLEDTSTARQAIERATEFAKTSDGSIRLIYVRYFVPTALMTSLPESFDSKEQARCEAQLAKLAAEIPLPADRISSVVRMGSVYKEVLDEADKVGASLIIIGSRRPSVTTFLLGSNAATIVRHAKASVLVIR